MLERLKDKMAEQPTCKTCRLWTPHRETMDGHKPRGICEVKLPPHIKTEWPTANVTDETYFCDLHKERQPHD